MAKDVPAVLEERVVNALRHEDVAPENATERRPFDLVDAVSKVVLRLVLLHAELQLADCVLNLDLEDHIPRLLLGQSVVHLDDVVLLSEAHVVNRADGLLEVVQRIIHDFRPKEVADLELCLDLLVLSLLHHFGDLLDPGLHHGVDHIADLDMAHLLHIIALLAQSQVNLLNDGFHPFRSEFLLEHLLEDAQDGLELLTLVSRQFHANAEKCTIGLSSDTVNQALIVLVKFLGLFVHLDNLSVDLFVVFEEFHVFEEVNFLVFRRLKVLQLKSRHHVSPFSILLRLLSLEAFRCFSRQPFRQGHEFLLDLEDRPLLDEDALVEVLHEELGQDVEVLLVVLEKNLNFIIDIVDVGKFELVLLDDPHDLKDLLLENLLDTDRLLGLA
jgi:hypothetical protein